jgi:hypothetical protein
MAAENIGDLIPTKIPGYSDAADIQAALRLYHYGSYSYDPANTSAASLVNPSIAYTLNDLQDQIDIIGSGGISPTVLTAKGSLISATAASTPVELLVGATTGMVLTINSSTATGLEWQIPQVTLANSVTLSNKTLTAPKFADLGFIADANGNEMIIFDTVASAVNEITLANAAASGTPTITASGGDTNISINLVPKGSGTIQVGGVAVVTTSGSQTLTNKSISLGSNTLTGTIAQFNTALTDADFATLAGSETLSNKTLTAPKFADLGFIADANGNEMLIFDTVASAVNEITIANAAIAGTPTISATGSDTDISLNLVSKGSGTVNINGTKAATIVDIEELEILTLMGAIL